MENKTNYSNLPIHIQEIINKVQKGNAVMSPPFGYSIGWKGHEKTVIIDPIFMPIAKDIFELYATGINSIDNVSLMISKKHNRVLSRGGINNILRNVFYKGYMDVKGTIFPHPYPLFIEKELWDKCNTVLTCYRHKRRAPGFGVDEKVQSLNKVYLYRGIIRCEECKNFLTSQIRKDINYYNCSQSRFHKNITEKKYAPEETINNYVATALKKKDIDNFLEIVQKDRKKARSIIEQNFEYLSYVGGKFKYTFGVNLLYRRYRAKDYIKTKSLKEKNEIFTSNDPILNFLYKPKDIEEISEFLQKDAVECSNILMDYVLENKIEESSGLWKTKI